jgi:phosphatidate cytidylyltransferase
MGKHKLYEKISPGKTWEGSIGGAILTMLSVYLIAKWYPELSYTSWLIVAAIVIVFGTIGDLIESMLKRQAGIKDSGKIMPGHGGILDRFDSLLFSAPFIYFYLDMFYP